MCIVFIEDSFGQKLMKVVNRKDFEEKWRSKMTELLRKQTIKTQHEDPTRHHKTASETKDNGGNAKIDTVLEKVGLMMRKMINIETLIKNPLAKLDI
jgi:hypothetical protein